MANFYESSFAGFGLNDEDNGVVIEKDAIAPGWKQAKAEVEGRAGGYLGTGYEGFVVVTLSGKVIGASGPDLRLKQRAFLTALKSGPAALVIDQVTSYPEAVCDSLPTFTDSTDMLFATDFTVVFLAQPE